jgi:aconitate hydratase
MGSSRDWAAKGTMLLGVKAVIAESFERIHRCNLVFMGVLPLVFKEGRHRGRASASTGDESFDIALPVGCRAPARTSPSRRPGPTARASSSQAMLRIDTAVELEYSRNGGILQTVIRKKLNEAKQLA